MYQLMTAAIILTLIAGVAFAHSVSPSYTPSSPSRCLQACAGDNVCAKNCK
jgi:hypothetical protein